MQSSGECAVSSRVSDYTQETTLHGVNHITDRNRSTVQRAVWGCLFLVAFAAVLFYIVTGFIQYYSYPVATKYEHLTVPQMDFPSVTICNFNQICKSFIEEQNDPLMDTVAEILNPIVEAEVDFTDPVLVSELQSVNMESVGINGAHQKQEMFLECSFMAANHSEFPCRFHQELFRPIKTQMGNCFIFHPQSYIDKYGALVSTRPGFAGGLMFTINIEQYEYIIGSSEAGIKVLVHDPRVEPQVNELGLSVAPGTSTSMIISKQMFDNLPPPYEGSSCKDMSSSTGVENPLQYFNEYSTAACKQECMINHSIRKCGCIGFNMNVQNVPVCELFTFLTCHLPSLDEYYANSSLEESCHCFHPCQEQQYHLTASYAAFPNDYVSPFLQDKYQQSEDFFKKNLLQLNIFYGELSYTKVTQSPGYPSGSLFAETGGLLGLFLGASLLTVAEFAELIVSGLCVSKKPGVRQVVVQPQDKPQDNAYRA